MCSLFDKSRYINKDPTVLCTAHLSWVENNIFISRIYSTRKVSSKVAVYAQTHASNIIDLAFYLWQTLRFYNNHEQNDG